LGNGGFVTVTQHQVIRCFIQARPHLGAQPRVDAIGGGVDLIIMLYQADLASSAHRLLLFNPTIGSCTRHNKTRESMR
jgi:hypothetical protein